MSLWRQIGQPIKARQQFNLLANDLHIGRGEQEENHRPVFPLRHATTKMQREPKQMIDLIPATSFEQVSSKKRPSAYHNPLAP
jgi:hypothetical protein